MKIKICPNYLSTNCQQLNKKENRITIRAKANNFLKPRMYKNTFAYSAIDDWNSLPNNVKKIKNEKKFKESLKKSLQKVARMSDDNPYMDY